MLEAAPREADDAELADVGAGLHRGLPGAGAELPGVSVDGVEAGGAIDLGRGRGFVVDEDGERGAALGDEALPTQLNLYPGDALLDKAADNSLRTLRQRYNDAVQSLLNEVERITSAPSGSGRTEIRGVCVRGPWPAKP